MKKLIAFLMATMFVFSMSTALAAEPSQTSAAHEKKVEKTPAKKKHVHHKHAKKKAGKKEQAAEPAVK